MNSRFAGSIAESTDQSARQIDMKGHL